MKTKLKYFVAVCCLFGTILQLHSQGYIVPNGVVYAGYSDLLGGYEIDVLHDPTNLYSTGFSLNPQNINTFSFNYYVDVGVRVFLVSPNDPISLQPILSQSYTELTYPNSYVFNVGTPFYVGLYTGNQPFAPPNGIYSDPLFGWAELVNNNGVIQLLDSALAYQAVGIYAGTVQLVPEPAVFSLLALGGLLLGWRLWNRRI